MNFSDISIGIGITGSFCTFSKTIDFVTKLKETGADITPIFSNMVTATDNRFMTSSYFREKITEITGKSPITTIPMAEPIGPKKLLDVMVVCPCTGNTLAKLTNGITDSPVLMAAKAHLRNNRPLVISISTNDALGINFKNLGQLMIMKNIYIVPFKQDDYEKKPNSLVSDMNMIIPTITASLSGIQLQPVILKG